jgi:hypothetical protein
MRLYAAESASSEKRPFSDALDALAAGSGEVATEEEDEEDDEEQARGTHAGETEAGVADAATDEREDEQHEDDGHEHGESSFRIRERRAR